MWTVTKMVCAILALLFGPATAQPNKPLGEYCHGNAAEACYFVIDGEITEALADAAIALLEANQMDAFKVLLNSEGGNLDAGLRLGRTIRAQGKETRIGIYRDTDSPLSGTCLSACAYAFLGGNQRFIGEDSQIGFHRFAVNGGSQMEGRGGLVVGQMLAASVVAYIVEMGVDARLFTRAAETQFQSMYYPDRDQRIEFDVESVSGFDQFFMEPYRNGVVVASRRLGPTNAYDRIDQLTAYCQNGQARVLLSISGANAFVPGVEGANFQVQVADTVQPDFDDWFGVNDTSATARTWSNGSGGFIEIAFDPSDVPITDTTRVFAASFFRSRADGGNHQAFVLVNDMDRQMLRTAFRMCI